MKFDFRIHATTAEGLINRRYHKVRYTAALRFGVVLPDSQGFIQLSFLGSESTDVFAHRENVACSGALTLDGNVFEDVIVIIKPRAGKAGQLVTFWPRSQHPDAHQSYTDPLVDTAVDGTPVDIEVVASRMHAVFKVNAAASPATLMKRLYEEETEALRASSDRLGVLLEESFERERTVTADLDDERAARVRAEETLQSTRIELESLKAKSFIQPPTGVAPKLSPPVVLKRVTLGHRGKNNQRAVLLHMDDRTIRACNFDDGFEDRFRYAQRLVGATVQTDVWGVWPYREWFNNIYLVSGAPTTVNQIDDGLPF